MELSAAFDAIDHDILLCRLKLNFGFNGAALSWFRSYLTDRQQIAVVRVFRSAPSFAEYGVPQGSVPVPILFVLHITSLDEMFPLVILLATMLLLTTHNSDGHAHLTLFKILVAEWRNVHVRSNRR